MGDSLIGTVRGTNLDVSTDDVDDREHAINALDEVFGWKLRSNDEKYKIDLLHNNRRGGVDVEKGGWTGLYRNQESIIFNKYTLDIPTANLPWRKEHFFNKEYRWRSNKGNYMEDIQLDYEYNSIIRFNHTYDEFFFVDYEIYQKIYNTGLENKLSGGLAKGRGCWKTDGIYAVNRYGYRVPEHWMCWELKDVVFYKKNEKGVWEQDRTLENPITYQKFVEEYKKNKEIHETVS